jgi:tetratricopeptide (TPR) repeat protein
MSLITQSVYYLEREDERREIAENGRRLVREELDWSRQVEAFLVDGCYRRIPSDFLERRKERLARFGVNARQEALDYAPYFFLCGPCPDLAKKYIEAVPDWDKDPYLRSQHAVVAVYTAGASAYAEDVAAVLRERPGHPLTVFNHAALVFQQRAAAGAHAAMRETLHAIQCLAALDPVTLDLEAVEGLYVVAGWGRFRVEMSESYFAIPPGPERWRRIRDLYLFELRSNLGTLYSEAQQWDRARGAFEEAARLLPDDGYTVAALGRTLASLGRNAEAISCYQKAVSLEPFFASAQRELAALLVAERRAADAAEFTQDALAAHLQPDETRLHLYLLLGQARALMNDWQGARQAWEKGMVELRTGTLHTGVINVARPANLLTPEKTAQWQASFRANMNRAPRASESQR